MAAEKKPSAQGEPAPASAEPKTPSRKKPLVMVAVLMLVEGVAIFFGTKMLTGSAPEPASAAHATADAQPGTEGGEKGGGHGGGAAKNAPAEPEFGEIAISECRPTNRVSGRLVTFRMRVSVLVKASEIEKTKALIESNKARIDDRINFVIRSADPTFLNEPTLETIKRRLKAELDRLMGDEHLIEEILIPEMLASAPGL